MTPTPEHHQSVVNRRLRLSARSDVQSIRVAFSGQSTHVLKDPITLELFHLTAEEYFLFDRLKESISLGGLKKEFESRFAPRRVSVQTLQAYLNQLHSMGLLVSEAMGQGEQLVQSGLRRRRALRCNAAGRLLAIRLPGMDATGAIDWLYPRCRWMFSRGMLLAVAAIMLWALSILVGHAGEVAARLPALSTLVGPRHLLLLVVSIAIVKLLHELGHALACKHFGGRCHEMGVLLLALVPSLYCDVSDVWRLPNKWQRIGVSAAGMVVELVLAAMAAILWWHTEPGLFNTCCLNIVVVCSVGTLLVNANPLMRYDGYYILADLLEVPNLATRAHGLFGRSLKRWLLAEPADCDPLLSPGKRRGLVAYAFAAKIYLALMLIGVFLVMSALARPYHLENLVYTLAAVVLVGYFAPSIISLGKWLGSPVVMKQMRPRRLVGLTTGAVCLLAAILFWPITGQVIAPVVLVPAGAEPIFATATGQLRYAIKSGSQVQSGDVIARLSNPAAELALEERLARYGQLQLRREQLLASQSFDERASRQLPTVEAALANAKAQLEKQQQEAERLVLVATQAGQIIAPPDRPRHSAGQTHAGAVQLATWSGSPLSVRNEGCWIESGTMLCVVADPAKLEAWVAVDQSDVATVLPGQSVRISTEQYPYRVLEGEVVQVARRSTRHENQHGNGAAAFSQWQRDSSQHYHVVRVRIDSQNAQLLAGARGMAKIETSEITMATAAVRWLRSRLRLPW